MDKSFSENLEKSLSHLRGFALASVIQDLIASGFLAYLQDPRDIGEMTKTFQFREDLLPGLLRYLQNEEILSQSGPVDQPKFQLTPLGQGYLQCQGWFNLLVGGYSEVFGSVSTILREGPKAARRDSKMVSLGSGQIDHFDAIPLARRLLNRGKVEPSLVLDYGCGNASFLCELCQHIPQLRGIGLDPEQSALEEAKKNVEKHQLESRIRLVRSSTLCIDETISADLVTFFFVLQEILGQEGQQRLVDFLKTMGKQMPSVKILVIEVHNGQHDAELMTSEIGKGYYNPYFLVHPLTQQRLVSDQMWQKIFELAGFRIILSESLKEPFDPTGYEIGYLLEFDPKS